MAQIRPLRLKERSIDVTSDSSGSASVTFKANGLAQKISLIEDDTDTPTSGWEMSVKDRDEVEVWNSGSISADTIFYPKVQAQDSTGSNVSGIYNKLPLKETLTLDFTGMGDSKKATIRFKWR